MCFQIRKCPSPHKEVLTFKSYIDPWDCNRFCDHLKQALPLAIRGCESGWCQKIFNMVSGKHSAQRPSVQTRGLKAYKLIIICYLLPTALLYWQRGNGSSSIDATESSQLVTCNSLFCDRPGPWQRNWFFSMNSHKTTLYLFKNADSQIIS